MTPLEKCLFVCALEEREKYRAQRISHLITIANPGGSPTRPTWFTGAHLELRFGDVISEADARQCKTKAPDIEDIQRALEFFRQARGAETSQILVSCDYGASRSPGLAYVCIADELGAGREKEAMELLLRIRSAAIPNSLIVSLGDRALRRDGALMLPLRELHAERNALLFRRPS